MDCSLEDTSLRALKSRAKFTHYAFLIQSRDTAEKLRTLMAPLNNTQIIETLVGNPNNEKTLCRLLDFIPRSNSALVLIDPSGYRRLSWTTLQKLVAHGKNWQGEKMELLIIFPLEMALLRNLMRPECQTSLTRFYGNQQWEDIKRQITVSKIAPEDIKYKLVELYKDGLRNLGYRYVEDFKPASPTPDPYYHLIYAGDSISRRKYIKEAWGKTRFLRCELLYSVTRQKSS
jgi:three-Cys-motif partner protein